MRKLFSLRVKPDDNGWLAIEGSFNVAACFSSALVVWFGLWMISFGVEAIMAAVK